MLPVGKKQPALLAYSIVHRMTHDSADFIVEKENWTFDYPSHLTVPPTAASPPA